MAGIAVANVTHSIEKARRNRGRKQNLVKLVFGDGALTYPSGGVPIDKAQLGCPNALESLVLVDAANANGFVYKFDVTNAKLRIYQGDNTNVAAAPLIEIATSVTPAAATLYAEVIGW